MKIKINLEFDMDIKETVALLPLIKKAMKHEFKKDNCEKKVTAKKIEE